MAEQLPHSAERMIREVGTRQRRIERGRANRRNIWDAISILGTIGWSITLPTLAGVFAGIWLDHRFPRRFSWTLSLLFAGLVIGCANAYRQLKGDRQ